MTSVIFLGTPEFAVPILEGLIDHQYNILAVMTQPNRKVGRKQRLAASPVKQAAQKYDIPVLQPEKLSGSPELGQAIAMAPDLIVTAAYGQFLPTKFLEAAKIIAVNVHGSLLPKYRGGAPIQYSIMNSDSETGVTIIEMVKKMDAGDMFAQAKLPLTRADDTGTVFAKLSLLGRDLLLETLPKIIAGTATRTPQDPDKVTFSPIITKEQEHLNIHLPAKPLDQWIRALRPDVGGYVYLNGQRTKLWAITPLSAGSTLPAGSIVERDKHCLVMVAGQQTTFQVDELQTAGKARQSIADFLNGPGQQLASGQQVITDDAE